MFFFSSLHSWNSYSVSWLECWGRETPTRLDTRSSSARTTASAMATPHRLALATHLPRPLTISSELNLQVEEGRKEQEEEEMEEWVTRSSTVKQSMIKNKTRMFVCGCVCVYVDVSGCVCGSLCVCERESDRETLAGSLWGLYNCEMHPWMIKEERTANW